MSDDYPMKGTGETLGTVGPIEVNDDGDPDLYLETVYDGTHGPAGVFNNLRKEIGDEAFIRFLENCPDSVADGPDDADDTEEIVHEAVAEDDAVEQLLELRVGRMAPVDALDELYRLQQIAKGERDP